MRPALVTVFLAGSLSVGEHRIPRGLGPGYPRYAAVPLGPGRR